jgi:hypothetical protein
MENSILDKNEKSEDKFLSRFKNIVKIEFIICRKNKNHFL